MQIRSLLFILQVTRSLLLTPRMCQDPDRTIDTRNFKPGQDFQTRIGKNQTWTGPARKKSNPDRIQLPGLGPASRSGKKIKPGPDRTRKNQTPTGSNYPDQKKIKPRLDWTRLHQSVRAIERSSDRAIERPSDRATERPSDRAIERPSDVLIGLNRY